MSGVFNVSPPFPRRCFVVGLAFAAPAATVTTSFDFAAPGWASESALSFTSGDLDLTVRGGIYATPGAVGSALNVALPVDVTRSGGYGLYIGYLFDNDHRIDGLINETALFSFSKAVRITGVTFGNILPDSVFDLFVGTGSDAGYAGSEAVATSVAVDRFGDYFGIGASKDGVIRDCVRRKKGVCKDWDRRITYSAFKITGLTVAYHVKEPPAPVPLPAAGVLLAGALALLGVTRRRRQRA